MSYTIQHGYGLGRDLRRLPRPVLDRINGAILALAETPRPRGCVKLAGSDDQWRIRVGDYRIVYRIDDAQLQITVELVGHRREAYCRL
jgi:mRNA interferase RelE/StbE